MQPDQKAKPALSADEQMIQDGFNALLQDYLNSNHRRKRALHHAPDCRGAYCLPRDGTGFHFHLFGFVARRGGGYRIYGRGY